MDSEKLLGVEPTLAEVMRFLDGVGPLDGCWFGEQPAGMGRFWWRAHLRRAFAQFEALNNLHDLETLARQIDPDAKWTNQEMGWATPEFVLRRAVAMRKARNSFKSEPKGDS